MNNYLSEKLKIISFISMIMVVFLHSYTLVVKSLTGNVVLTNGYNLFIQDFFSQGITRVAVPLFFMISGYLFYLKMEGTFSEFVIKFKKRIKTLALPYIFWSIWGLLFYFVLQLLPQSKPFFTKELIRDYSLNTLLNTIFLNPISFQLWFLRDLIVIVFLSPIIYWTIRYIKFVSVIIFLIAWFNNFDFIIFSNEALLFFVFGAFLSLEKKKLPIQDLSMQYYWIYTYIWLAIVSCKTILVYIEFNNSIILDILLKTGILFGIIAIWSMYDILIKNKTLIGQKFYAVTSYSFFLFAFHEPVLTVLKKGLFYMIGHEEFSSLCIYIAAPILTISFSIFIGYYFKRYIPKFYELITGGR